MDITPAGAEQPAPQTEFQTCCFCDTEELCTQDNECATKRIALHFAGVKVFE